MVALWLAAGLVLGFVTSMPPAGPIAILVLQRGVLRRFREGMAIALGGAVAEAIYVVLALLGVAALLEQFPSIGLAARVVGIAILLGLAFYFLRFKPPATDTPEESTDKRGGAGSLLLGFTIAISNVTLICTWSTLVAVIYSMGNLQLPMTGKIAFAAGVLAGICAWFLVLLAALRRFGRHLTILAAVRSIRVAGLLLLGLAVFAAVSLHWVAKSAAPGL
jgi:threonine/homoserine/homoserine lactone efflux protein